LPYILVVEFEFAGGFESHTMHEELAVLVNYLAV
jgi:hypothetical protein